MVELKLTPNQARILWAALLVAETNALNEASGRNRQKALDMANELRALRQEVLRARDDAPSYIEHLAVCACDELREQA